MIDFTPTSRRPATLFACAVAAAAIGIPAAQSNSTRNSAQAVPLITEHSDVVSRYLNNQARTAATDAGDVVSRYLSNQALAIAETHGYTIITDTLAPGGGTAAVAAGTDSGFQWGDASVGAAVSAGSMVVLLGGSLVLLRRRERFAH